MARSASTTTQATGPQHDRTAAPAGPPPTLLLDAEAVGAMCDLAGQTIRRLVAEGKAPRPVKCGNSVRWRCDEVVAWIAAGCPVQADWERMRKDM